MQVYAHLFLFICSLEISALAAHRYRKNDKQIVAESFIYQNVSSGMILFSLVCVTYSMLVLRIQIQFYTCANNFSYIDTSYVRRIRSMRQKTIYHFGWMLQLYLGQYLSGQFSIFYRYMFILFRILLLLFFSSWCSNSVSYCFCIPSRIVFIYVK